MPYNKSVHIGENVWVGTGTVIVQGVTIGKNSVIGAGSVVTKNIPDNLKLTVLTNSYSIAHVCSLKEQIRVIILGGDLLKDSMTTVGEVAAAQAAAYHPDLCFMGVYAIHPEYGMTIPYPEEVSIKRQLIRSSSRVIALVNPIKLNTVSRYQVCGIEDFTTLITDGNVPQEMASRYKNRGLDFL